ncbi:SDR family oxidoreductase [Novosphingobium sp.]|uniref:SDR family oxidoreductase n=1 Tax=Novosphingobium sp. TaxID=1874826 RepID=UPI00262EDCB2|nr:SDR family NAD(P)-dependent oxidoreductase [Novosphingobium sp.]
MNLAGKTILLTGGTDGIGRELALQLRALGATVIVTGRTPERLADMAGQGFETVAAELSGPEGVEAVLAALGSRPVDVLINNAGAGSSHDFRVAPPDLADNDRCIFLNLNAPIHLITRLMPVLRARPEAMIVNVTSGLAIAPRSGSPVYCATKAALRSYTQALRAQLAGTGIHVLEALPPVVETKMTAGRNQRKMPASECARQIIVAMQRNAPEANVGLTRLLRTVYSLSPALARKVMLRF